MRAPILATFVCGLAANHLSLARAATCNALGGSSRVTLDGHTYDFTHLASAERNSSDAGPEGTTYEYHFRMCGNCNETCPGGDIEQGAVVQKYTDASGMAQCYILAQWDNTGVWKKTDKGVQVRYHNGDDCGNGNPRTTIVNLNCDQDADVPKDDSWKVTNTNCEYTMNVPTKEACGPGDEGMGWGSAFLLTLCLTGAIYFVVGFGYNYRFEGSGFSAESIPHREFWSQFPGLVRDGLCYSSDRVTRWRETAKRKSSPGVPTDAAVAGAGASPDDAEYGTGHGNLGAGLLAGKKKPICADDI